MGNTESHWLNARNLPKRDRVALHAWHSFLSLFLFLSDVCRQVVQLDGACGLFFFLAFVQVALKATRTDLQSQA